MKIRSYLQFFFRFLACFAITIFPRLSSAIQENIPLDSWVYPFLIQLHNRGYFSSLWLLSKPWTREEITNSVFQTKEEIDSGKLKLKKDEQWLFEKLIKEFQKDKNLGPPLSLPPQGGIRSDYAWRFRIWGKEELRTRTEEPAVGRAAVGANSGLHLQDKLVLYVVARVDQNILDDSTYYGYKWRGKYFGDFDAAYIQGKFSRFLITLGRKELFWGPSLRGSLILSNNAPPLDLFSIQVTFGKMRLLYFTTQLDYMKNYYSPQTNTFVESANRYLVGHRLDWLLPFNFELGLTEIFLYGGPGRSMEMHFLNPLLLYHSLQLNDQASGNTMWGVDCLWRPFRKFEVYGELMIDDFQIEKRVPSDYEAAAWGIQGGMRASSPFELNGSFLSAEYFWVSNWCYNNQEPFSRYIYKNRVTGAWFGNDGDNFWVSWNQLLSEKWSATLKGEIKRHGEGRPDADWPIVEYWFQPRKFPSGIVETQQSLGAQIKFWPSLNTFFLLNIRYLQTKNLNNQPNKNENKWELKLTVSSAWEWL